MGSRDGPQEKEKEMIPQTQMGQLTKGVRGESEREPASVKRLRK